MYKTFTTKLLLITTNGQHIGSQLYWIKQINDWNKHFSTWMTSGWGGGARWERGLCLFICLQLATEPSTSSFFLLCGIADPSRRSNVKLLPIFLWMHKYYPKFRNICRISIPIYGGYVLLEPPFLLLFSIFTWAIQSELNPQMFAGEDPIN